jgi:hypothetical protein
MNFSSRNEGKTLKIDKNKIPQAGGMAQWQGMCLTSTRPWLSFQALINK